MNLSLGSYGTSYALFLPFLSDFSGKFAIACVRLILGKIGVDGFTGPRRETYMKNEFGFKVIL